VNKSRTPIVYVLSAPRPNRYTHEEPNTLALMQYGQVKYLIPRGISPEFNPEVSAKMLQEGLKQYDPAIDYLTTVGGSYFGAFMMGWILALLSEPSITWLRFERDRMGDGSRSNSSGSYWPVTMHMDELLIELTE